MMFSRTPGSKLCYSVLPLTSEVPNAIFYYSQRRFISPCRESAFRSFQNVRAFSGTAPRGSNKNYTLIAPTRRPGHGKLSLPYLAARIFSTDGTPDGHQSPGLQMKSTRPGEPTIHAVFDKNTSTWQYVVADPASSRAVIIDPVLDYNRTTQTISTETADSMLKLVKDQGYRIDMILETHIHADHLTASSYLQVKLTQDQFFQPPIGIGKRIDQVQNLFGHRYGIPEAEYKGVFGRYFDDDEVFRIGKLNVSVLHLPGHTPDHLGYKIGDNVFCGDSIFHADIGTARCDFPGGDPRDLFKSARKLLGLSDQLKIWPGHDYPPLGRDGPRAWMSVQEHRRHNKHLMDGVTENVYVALRQERDAKMSQPKLLHPSLQINLRAGRLPNMTPSGYRMLHLPIKVENVEW